MIQKLAAVYQVPTQRGFAVSEAAKYLGMHPQTLRRLSDLGEVPCRTFGKRRLFLLEDLDAWLEARAKRVSDGNS
jgi:excisionase family DNA binding protein